MTRFPLRYRPISASGGCRNYLQPVTKHSQWADLDDDKRVILCIEDNLANIALLRAILDVRPDLKLISAREGQLGIDLARKHLPALILLDLQLPDVSGQEILAKLRGNPDTQHIPVVVTSADASPKRMNALVEQGADAYLTKPLDILEFCKVVDQQISQRQ